MIEVTDVSKTFARPKERKVTLREHLLGLVLGRGAGIESLRALRGVSFRVHKGERKAEDTQHSDRKRPQIILRPLVGPTALPVVGNLVPEPHVIDVFQRQRFQRRNGQ